MTRGRMIVNRAVEEGLLNDSDRRLWVVGVGAADVTAAPVKWCRRCYRLWSIVVDGGPGVLVQ